MGKKSRANELAEKLYQIARIPIDDRPSPKELINLLLNESVARVYGRVGCYKKDIFEGVPLFEYMDGEKVLIRYEDTDISTSVRIVLSTLATSICKGLPIGVDEQVLEGVLTLDLMNMVYRFDGLANKNGSKSFVIPEEAYQDVVEFDDFVSELDERIRTAVWKRYKTKDIVHWSVYSYGKVVPSIRVEGLRERFWASRPEGLNIRWEDLERGDKHGLVCGMGDTSTVIISYDPFSIEFYWFWEKLLHRVDEYLRNEKELHSVVWYKGVHFSGEYLLSFNGVIEVEFSCSFRIPEPCKLEGSLFIPS